MNFTEKHAWFWLACNEGIGTRGIKKLISKYGSALSIFYEGVKAEGSMLRQMSEAQIIEEYEKNVAKDINFITADEKEFPERLKNICDAPLFLFFKGMLPRKKKPVIAIIGARACSGYGQSMAFEFAKKLSMAGVQIVSGMAHGVDRYAHEGALSANAYNLAVLGNGVDVCYPPQNRHIFEQITENGGIVSEYPQASAPLPFHFPLRNRLISAFSDGILVIEARKRSGSLITAEYGLEQGKSIYALPGRITDSLSTGCNLLIQSGAKLVENVNDILEELELIYPILREKGIDEEKRKLNRTEQAVYDVLTTEVQHIDTIISKTGLDYFKAIEVLFELEISGFSKSEGASCFRKR